MKFDRDELFGQDSASLENKEDMIFRQSIVLCSMFEDLMRTLSWQAGDILDIEADLCDVVGQLVDESGTTRQVEFVGWHAECNNEHSSN